MEKKYHIRGVRTPPRRPSVWKQALAGFGLGALISTPALGVYVGLRGHLNNLEARLALQEEHNSSQDDMIKILDDDVDVLGEWTVLASRRIAKPDGKYDFDNSLIDFENDPLETITQSMYTLRTTFTNPLTGKPDEMEGVGTVMFGRYLFTVDHIVKFSLPLPVHDAHTVVIDKQGNEIELETVIKDKENDIAVFRLPKDHGLQPLPYSVGNSDELNIGNLVYIIGNPGMRGYHIRKGIVGATHILLPGLPQSKDFVYPALGVNPGDSGSLVVAVRDGKYEVVGLPKGIIMGEQDTGFIIGITPYMNHILDRLEADDKLKEMYEDLHDVLKTRYGKEERGFH